MLAGPVLAEVGRICERSVGDAKTCPECRATTDPVLILCGACGAALTRPTRLGAVA